MKFNLRLVHGSRAAFHVFAVLGLVALPLAAGSELGSEQRPLLWVIAVIVGGFDWLLQKGMMGKQNYEP